MCSFQDIVYHAVRCSLYHTASVSSDLRFHEGQSFKVESGRLVLPASLVLGLIVTVVVSPANKSEVTLDERHGINICGYQVSLKRLWGKRQELLELYRAMDEIQKDRP